MWLSLAVCITGAAAGEAPTPPVESTVATVAAEPIRAGASGVSLHLERMLHQHAADATDLDILSVNIDRGIEPPRQSVLDLRDGTWDALFGSHVLEVRRGLEGTPRAQWQATASPRHTVAGRRDVEGLCVDAGARASSGELELLVEPPPRPDRAGDRALRKKRPAWAFWSSAGRRQAATTIQPGESVTVVQVMEGDLDGQPDTRLEVTAEDWSVTVHEAPGSSRVCVSYGASDAPR